MYEIHNVFFYNVAVPPVPAALIQNCSQTKTTSNKSSLSISSRPKSWITEPVNSDCITTKNPHFPKPFKEIVHTIQSLLLSP
ncbi:hypothetical protein RchiOBHm_Chr6g0301931 [Rosa chinensis]|uniref:Uncharacterized protein n=1 Tax=Rosa chinensis TaxID=74649 RepID=A0A2P6PYW2_ROSCH|nr:hypothetical protein RchiOBHm_Chr6g0301931 [Rosa chinensis]